MAGELLEGSGDVLNVVLTTPDGFNEGLKGFCCLCGTMLWCSVGMANGKELMPVICLGMLLLLRDKGTGNLSRLSRLRPCGLWVFNNTFCI